MNRSQGMQVHAVKGNAGFCLKATLRISCRFLAQRSVQRLRCLRELATELRNFQRTWIDVDFLLTPEEMFRILYIMK
jgi:hypothetical protein